MRMIEAEGRIGPGGVALAALAAALVAVGLMAPPVGGPVVLVQWGASLLLTVCLCFARMPAVLRALLVAGMLGIALGDAAGADPIGAQAAQRRIDREAEVHAIERAREEAASHGAASARRGAAIALDGDWGRRIAGPLDETLGGPKAASLSVIGTAAGSNVGGSGEEMPRVAIAWSIGGAGARARCGTTTIAGPSPAAIVDAARMSIGHAVDASIARGVATCG